jgi:hypothetical protein
LWARQCQLGAGGLERRWTRVDKTVHPGRSYPSALLDLEDDVCADPEVMGIGGEVQHSPSCYWSSRART